MWVAKEKHSKEKLPCHLPRPLERDSSRLESSAFGTVSSETLSFQPEPAKFPYWCSMVVPEGRLTTNLEPP